MIDGEIAIRIATHMIDPQTQFQRPVFQTLGFDEQSGHISSEFELILRVKGPKSSKKWVRGQSELFR